jgi:hypothetical protein
MELLWSDIAEVSESQSEQRLLEMLDDSGFTATSFQEGSIVSTLIKMQAEAEARLSKISVLLKNAFQSATATGEALTRTSSGFFKNTRADAVASQHLATLSCLASAGPHTINLGDVVIFHADGHTYRNVEGNSIVYPVVLASGGTQTLLFESQVAGAQANIGNAVSVDQVTLALDTTLAGVSITAHSLFLAGVDEESDDRLDERNTSKWALLSGFEIIDEAVEALCLAASSSIIATSVDSTNPRGAGTFDVYIAGLDATASDTDVALAQALVRRYVFGMDATVQVKKAPELGVDIVGTAYYSGNFTQAEVQTAVEAALLAYVRRVPLGGFDFSPGPQDIIPINDIESVIRTTIETLTLKSSTVVLTTPAANIPVPARARARLNTPGIVYQAING